MRSYVANHPEITRRFLRGLLAAERFVKEHPQEAVQIISQQVGIDAPTLTRFISGYDLDVAISSELTRELSEEGKWAIDVGIALPGSVLPDYKFYIISTPLHSIDGGRVNMSVSSDAERQK